MSTRPATARVSTARATLQVTRNPEESVACNMPPPRWPSAVVIDTITHDVFLVITCARFGTCQVASPPR